MLTYHLIPRDEYDPLVEEYAPAAFAQEGFIHTTKTLVIIHEVANRYYRADLRPYLLLTVDLDRVTATWRYDAAGEAYPHLYGPLNRASIVGSIPCPRAADGTFLPLTATPA